MNANKLKEYNAIKSSFSEPVARLPPGIRGIATAENFEEKKSSTLIVWGGLLVLEVPHNARRYRQTERERETERETKYKLLYGDIE